MDTFVVFREITSRICGTLDLAEALYSSFRYLSELIPLDEMRINILDSREIAVRTIARADRNGGVDMIDDPLVIRLSREAFLSLSGKELPDIRSVPVMTDDKATAEASEKYFSHIPDSSMLIMRMLLDGKRQGALLLRAEGKNRYTRKHIDLLAGLNTPFAIAVHNAQVHKELKNLKELLKDDNHFLRRELGKAGGDQLIGADFGLASIMELVSRVAPTGSPVLILGETGTGKEIIAGMIHRYSERRDRPLIKLNCGAIPQDLLDSELFGHEKGAFTGASAQKKGRFERADGGTLFLDEIGELSQAAQSKLLRVLQTGEYERVGGTQSLHADVRIVAATHRDLPAMIREGSFREDLWYRLNVFPLFIPPLRQRKADIPALLNHFIDLKSGEMGIVPAPVPEPESLSILSGYNWPGNVRELENIIERAIILSGETGSISFKGLIQPAAAASEAERQTEHEPEKSGFLSLEEMTSRHIERVLAHTGGRIGGPGGAAEILDENPSTLRNRMKRLGIYRSSPPAKPSP